MKTLYLVGGSGFIGKNLVDSLEKDYSITVFDKYIDESFFVKKPLVKIVCMNLVEDEIPQEYPTPDYIVNLASIVTAERDMSLFDGLISSNLKILLNLYNRFKGNAGLQLFIQFGSSEEYGNVQSPFVETQREEPNSPYALVKQLTVNTAMMLNRNYGFPIMAVRPGNLFGKYQNKSKFLPYVISQLQADADLNVTSCEQKRDFICASDFAWCIGRLLEDAEKCRGQVINVSSGKSFSLKSIIEHLRKEIGSKSKVNYGAVAYRENEMMDLCCSMEKFEKTTGTKIDFDFYKSLTKYIEEI